MEKMHRVIVISHLAHGLNIHQIVILSGAGARLRERQAKPKDPMYPDSG
jgi:hypothetical protein